MIVVLLAFTAILAIGFRESMDYVDELDRDAQVKMVANYLERAGNGSIGQQKVQLTWDDGFKAVVLGKDMAWADTYLGDFLWTNFNYERLFLVSPRGELIRAWADGKPTPATAYAPIRRNVATGIREMAKNRSVFGKPVRLRPLQDTSWPFDAKGRPLTRWHSALINYQGHPAVLTVASILPDTDYSLLKQTPGNLVAIRYMDAQFLERLGAGLQLGRISVSQSPPSDKRVSSFALKGYDSEPIGWLTWKTQPRSTLVQARVLPIFVAFVLCILAMVIGGVAMARTLMLTLRELKAREAQSHHNALHDAMTGLPNRVQFLQKLRSRLDDRDKSDPDDLVIVAFFDLDHFKFINDTLGHHVGDELIGQVAHRFRGWLLDSDVLARLGGDEFVLLRTARTASPEARNVGREVIALLTEPFNVFGHVINVTASCGISWAPTHTEDPGELLRNADIALYRAKQRGRGRWRIFTPEMDASVRWRHELEVDLRRAIEHDQLRLVYQPIVETEHRRIASLEALLRWHHPERGEVGPGVFVPIAEQSGLMEALGSWVIRRVFAETRHWPVITTSINLSPLQIMSRSFLGELRETVQEYRIDPSRYTFEVTEGILLDRTDHVLKVLSELRSMGFKIVLDDFGIGFSSLSYLRSFKFDGIKVDRSFVQNIENDLDAHAILRAITSLGNGLRMKIVAEGVETSLQHDLVVAAGCHYVQGHVYWQAMAPEEIFAILGAEQPRELRRKAG